MQNHALQVYHYDLPGLCFLPLFHGMFPLFALEILFRLNFSLSANAIESSLEDSTWSAEVSELVLSCSFSQQLVCPCSLGAKDLGSKTATALIWSLLLSKAFTFLGNSIDFPNDDSPLSSQKVNVHDKTLQWTWNWALSGPRGFWKEAWAVAISAPKNNHTQTQLKIKPYQPITSRQRKPTYPRNAK